jgi:hypothetical protein
LELEREPRVGSRHRVAVGVHHACGEVGDVALAGAQSGVVDRQRNCRRVAGGANFLFAHLLASSPTNGFQDAGFIRNVPREVEVGSRGRDHRLGIAVPASHGSLARELQRPGAETSSVKEQLDRVVMATSEPWPHALERVSQGPSKRVPFGVRFLALTPVCKPFPRRFE